MRILITGYSGFIGSNLISRLRQIGNDKFQFYLFNSKSNIDDILDYTKDCDFIFNLAAVHRPKDSNEFYDVNFGLLNKIIESLILNKNYCPILYTSSIQANENSDYGKSKTMAEDLLINYSKQFNQNIFIYRLTNTFGAGARPNGHSVVATFCNNIQHNIDISINAKDKMMHFYYIDDVIDAFVDNLTLRNNISQYYYELPKSKIIDITLGELAYKLFYFKECKDKNRNPVIKNSIDEKFLITFKSYGEKR